MPVRRKLADGSGADALSGAVRCPELGMLSLEIDQFSKEPVIFGIAQRGLLENVVEVVRLLKLFSQLGGAFGGSHALFCHLVRTCNFVAEQGCCASLEASGANLWMTSL